jgi:zinc carboxypeptidase
MIRHFSPRVWAVAILLALTTGLSAQQSLIQPKPGRDPKQPIDEEYTRKIREYTTEPFFTSPLVDYLPASKTVPTPKAVLGDVAGAPGILPYSKEVYQYMRLLEKASPRVKVFSIGTTEEGREHIAVAVASEALISRLDENRARLARLADPRVINANDDEAEKLVQASVPVYYITGTIHSPETGAPTALMELAYRLAVDESAYIQQIRNNLITLITPIVEVDGRDRMVDVYKWHLAHPNDNWPPLLYWGKYVAHDNNRDAMGLTLKLSQNILNEFVKEKAQVLHDLHESVPYLYDNTVGDGPYNAWLDPILTDEWQMLGWNNVSEMTKFGMPGVFTHGTFDTWSPGYLMFMAATHNGISRLYETFGNGGADTIERTLSPAEYSRTWYRQNPPLPKVKWSQRNNNNYEQTGLLTALSYFSQNGKLFLRNFYLKSKRSVLKPKNEGPAGWVLPADDPGLGRQAELLRILQMQGVEISRATAPFTVTVQAPKRPRPETTTAAGTNGRDGTADSDRRGAAPVQPPSGSQGGRGGRGGDQSTTPQTTTREFPAGSYIVRMDQPYCRIADMLLDVQYWSPNDPQKRPYDDTAWSFPELFNVHAVRVTDLKVLDAPMEKITGPVKATSGITGTGTVFAVNANADPALIALRYRLKDAAIDVAEEPFDAAGRKFNRGSFLVRNVAQADFDRTVNELGLKAEALPSAPDVKTHPARAARIALVHTWQSTQTEGWWRLGLDKLNVPYTYISTQTVAKEPDLNAKYDVILFPPGGGNPQAIVSGRPMYGNPIPWKNTPETPNIGKSDDQTDDIRPGLGFPGLMNLQHFVRNGGVLVGVMETANLAVNYGMTPGVSSAAGQRIKVIGSILKTRTVDATSPIAYGYGDALSAYCDSCPIFGISHTVGGRGGRGGGGDDTNTRVTGRGAPDEQDQPQGRPLADAPPEQPKVDPWQAAPITDEQRRNNGNIIPPAQRPRVVMRWADNRELLVAGLLENGNELAQRPAVIDVPTEKGHVVLFSNNPMWRGETQGSYALVFNTIMNFDSLNAGRKLDEK